VCLALDDVCSTIVGRDLHISNIDLDALG
jgi:hypothetical protein